MVRKVIFLVLVAILVGMLVEECKKASASTETVNLPTVKCSICKKAVEDALREVEGIQYAEVNLDNKNAVLTFDPSKTDLAKVEQAIANAGYNANDKERNPEAYEKLPDCCK